MASHPRIMPSFRQASSTLLAAPRAGLSPIDPPISPTHFPEEPEKFAAMIDRHWDGIAAYCQPDNKVALGFVEGLNNKVRVIQRRAYGLRDEEYLRLKILTSMLRAI